MLMLETLPSIVPGPFLLVLLLPTIPLVLFSIGARPPDTTTGFPFTSEDIFHTSALITAAGAVALCLGVYPDATRQVIDWVQAAAVTTVDAGDERVIVGAQGVAAAGAYHHHPYDGAAAAARDREGFFRQATTTTMMMTMMPALTTSDMAAARHLAALRQGVFKHWYHRRLTTTTAAHDDAGRWVGFGTLAIAAAIMVLGRVLNVAYERDEEREQQQRRAAQAKQRASSKDTTRSSSNSSKGTQDDADKKKDRAKAGEVKGEGRGKTSEDKGTGEDEEEEEEDEQKTGSTARATTTTMTKTTTEKSKPVKKKVGNGLRRMFLGSKLYEAVERQKAVRAAHAGRAGQDAAAARHVANEGFTTVTAAAAAPEIVANAARAASQMTAQALGRKVEAAARAAQ